MSVSPASPYFAPASLSATLIPRPGSVGREASCLGRLAILISEFSVAQSPQRSLCTVERLVKLPAKMRQINYLESIQLAPRGTVVFFPSPRTFGILRRLPLCGGGEIGRRTSLRCLRRKA